MKWEVVADCGVSKTFDRYEFAEAGCDVHNDLCPECETSASIKPAGEGKDAIARSVMGP